MDTLRALQNIAITPRFNVDFQRLVEAHLVAEKVINHHDHNEDILATLACYGSFQAHSFIKFNID